MDEKTERFLELFKAVEQNAILTYGYYKDGKAFSHLLRHPAFKDIRVELKAAKDVRNIITHYEGYVTYPSDSLIKALETALNRITGKNKAIDIMTSIESMLYAYPDDYVLPSIEVMSRCGYSYMPIIKEGTLWAIISPKTLINTIADKKITINESTKFMDIHKTIELTPSITHISFISSGTSEERITRLFSEGKGSRRLDILFVTKNGNPKEPLLGLITPYDVL